MRDTLRAGAYRWFASLFTAQLDAAGWCHYRNPDVADALSREFTELGLRPAADQFFEFLETHRVQQDAKVIEELAADFSSLFYGPRGGSAPPYQSLYAASPPRFFGHDHAEVDRLVLDRGLRLPAGWTGPADHAAIELDLIAHSLSDREAADATDCPGQDGPTDPGDAFRKWKAGALAWILRWSGDIHIHSRTGFYRGGADLLGAFLQAELADPNSATSESPTNPRKGRLGPQTQSSASVATDRELAPTACRAELNAGHS